MNVIFGKENLDQIDERYTALELETLLVAKDKEPITNNAIVGPDSGLGSMLKLKQFAYKQLRSSEATSIHLWTHFTISWNRVSKNRWKIRQKTGHISSI